MAGVHAPRPIADLYFSRLDVFGHHVLLAIQEDEVVARGFAVPFAMGVDLGRAELPASGWDGVIRWAWLAVYVEPHVWVVHDL